MEDQKFAFDLEGTLVDTEELHQKAFEHVAQNLGVTFGKEEFSHFIGAGDKAISTEISRLLGAKTLGPEKVREIKNGVYTDLLFSKPIEPREGVYEYLDKARSIAGDLVIASLTPKEFAYRIIENAKLAPFFTFVLTEADVARLKPDPEVFLKAAKVLDSKPQNVLVHEDSPPGVAAAKSAGSPVIALPVHEGIKFDPAPDLVLLSWVDQDPKQLAEKLKSGSRIV